MGIVYLLTGIGIGILVGMGFVWWSVIRHRRTPSLTKYVVFSISITVLYTIAEFIFSTVTHEHHDVLTEWVYKFFAGEVIFCALIKIFKLAPASNIKQKLEEMVGMSLSQEDDMK